MPTQISSKTSDSTGSFFDLWPSKVSANERRCFICNAFTHWLKPCSAWDNKRVLNSNVEASRQRRQWDLVFVTEVGVTIRVIETCLTKVDTAPELWCSICYNLHHYTGVTMSATASQITDNATVCSTDCPGAHQRKHQSSAPLAFVRGIHRWPVDSPHKWPVTRKMFPYDGVVIIYVAHYGHTAGEIYSRVGNYATAWMDSWRVTQQILYDFRNRFLTKNTRARRKCS